MSLPLATCVFCRYRRRLGSGFTRNRPESHRSRTTGHGQWGEVHQVVNESAQRGNIRSKKERETFSRTKLSGGQNSQVDKTFRWSKLSGGQGRNGEHRLPWVPHNDGHQGQGWILIWILRSRYQEKLQKLPLPSLIMSGTGSTKFLFLHRWMKRTRRRRFGRLFGFLMVMGTVSLTGFFYILRLLMKILLSMINGDGNGLIDTLFAFLEYWLCPGENSGLSWSSWERRWRRERFRWSLTRLTSTMMDSSTTQSSSPWWIQNSLLFLYPKGINEV